MTIVWSDLDQLDFQIFRSVGFRPYGPYAGDMSRLDPWKIAQKLGVDGKTVKLRIDRMQKQGFIKYYQIYPNYRLLGVSGVAYLLEAPDVEGKYNSIEKASLMEGVVEIHNFLGNAFCVDFAYRDSEDHRRRFALLKALVKEGSFCTRFYDRSMPAVDIKLSKLDWRIIKALRYDAFKRLSLVAEELGVSLKTVRRRFARMTSNNAVIIVPVIHPGEVPNTITYVLLFFLKEGNGREATIRAILDRFDSTRFLAYTPPTGNIMTLNFATTMGQTEDALLSAKSLNGVTDARLYILKDMREYSEWMDREIDAKLKETSRLTGDRAT